MKIYKSVTGQQQVLHSYEQLLAKWPIDHQAHQIETTYGVTHCLVAGQASNPPLLLLHGVGDNSAVMWALNIQTLAQHYYCLLKIINKLSSPSSRVYEQHPELAEHLVLLMKHHNQQAMFVHKLQKYDKQKATAVKDKLYFLLGDYKLQHKQDMLRVLEEGDFRYTIIADAGHGLNHEQPNAVHAELIPFLSTC